jgi:predicted TIM-barrel fold metal-dependent hydrolase
MKDVMNDPKAYIDAVLQSPGDFLSYLDSQGIDYGVCLAEINPLVTGTISNEEVLEFCKGNERLIPFANINPHLTRNLAFELERCIDLGHRGLKLYPTYQHFYPNEPRLYQLYGKAQDLRIPVMFHTGSSSFPGAKIRFGDPLYLDDVAVDFPDLTIIMSHAGRGFWYDRAFSLAKLHKNIYLDITGLPPSKLLKYFPELERIGKKILFGSDWPAITDISKNIEAIRSLPISEDTKRDILGLNAIRLLGLAGISLSE